MRHPWRPPQKGGAADRWRPLAAHRPPGAAALAAHRPLNSIHRPPVGAVSAADDPPNSSTSERRQRRMTRRRHPPIGVFPEQLRCHRRPAVPSFDRPPTFRRFVSQFADNSRRRPQRPIPAGNFGAGPTTRRRLRRLPLVDRRPMGDRRTAPQAHRRRRFKRRRRRVGRSVDWKIGAECDAPCAQ